MGAIISRKKGVNEKTVLHKTQAVHAFHQGNKKSQGQNQLDEATSDGDSDQRRRSSSHDEKTTTSAAPETEVSQNAESSEASHPDKSSEPTEIVNEHGVAATTIQSRVRGYQKRKQFKKQKEAAVVIQKNVRGHQVRKVVKRRSEAAIKIQRGFRSFLGLDTQEKMGEDKKLSGSDDKNIDRPWRHLPPEFKKPSTEMKIGSQTKESFEHYQDDISNLRWQGEQQKEMTTLGDDYCPQTILLLASNMPEVDTLRDAALSDVHCIVYDFGNIALEELQEEIHQILTTYRAESKAKMIGIVCPSESGVVYLLKGKALTSKKLENDPSLGKFIQCIGTMMSKLDPSKSVIHFIGSSVATNENGVKLLKRLSKAACPNKVKFEAPVDGSQAASQVAENYFDEDNYLAWKKLRFTKKTIF